MDGCRWLFRVASDPRWGGGHVSRCRVLARELVRQGSGASFWLDQNDGGWSGTLRAEGFGIVSDATAPNWPKWSGVLVDGYDLLDVAALNNMQAIARPLVCFVDHLPPKVDVDLTINAGAEPTSERAAGSLTGFRFSLVEPAFAEIPHACERAVTRLLVVMGRADICGASAKAVQALSKVAFPGPPPALSVVLGSSSPFLDDVRSVLAGYPGQSELKVDVKDMVQLYAESDAVVVAGGVSLLECLAAGRPNCVVRTADNQLGNVRQALALGGSIDGGDIAFWDEPAFVGAVGSLCSSASVRERLASNARRAIDGKGAERVGKAIYELHQRLLSH